MELTKVEQIGRNFAKRNQVWEPEAIAEANYLWVMYQHNKVCAIYGMQEPLIRRFIRFGLYKYFGKFQKVQYVIDNTTRKGEEYEVINKYEKKVDSDIEMLEYLSGHFNSDVSASFVLKHLNIGLTLEEVGVLSDDLQEAAKRVSKITKQKIQEIIEQINASVPTFAELSSKSQTS